MELISKILFWVANSLLIPDIIILLFLFARALLLIGSFYNQFIVRGKNNKKINGLIETFSKSDVNKLKEILPKNDNSLYIKYLRNILNKPLTEAYSDYTISNFENEADKDLSLSKVLAKLGPVLGLIGTLIAMSPALVGLSTGDIADMAYNMQVVFATTVVGLVVSAIGLITLQTKQRWYSNDLNNLDFVARVLTENQTDYEKTKEN
ncbi:MotA/TolQ/ExbB proton channel family protein [Apibacter raozihei]|uniref:MotA/TolQ/ExbB proton channel family protein n=1 Tax=Apibacter TaxID=1778601 RepID=UPI000FE3BB6E|nr:MULTISPECIES: MotA/TolQ/ExbB proton channel family protein [Apibacter]